MKQQLPALANTPHPCAHLPDGAKHVFDRIARGQQPELHSPWVGLLLARRLVAETGAKRVVGWNTKADTEATISMFAVPPAVMDQWRAYERSLIQAGMRAEASHDPA